MYVRYVKEYTRNRRDLPLHKELGQRVSCGTWLKGPSSLACIRAGDLSEGEGELYGRGNETHSRWASGALYELERVRRIKNKSSSQGMAFSLFEQ